MEYNKYWVGEQDEWVNITRKDRYYCKRTYRFNWKNSESKGTEYFI